MTSAPFFPPISFFLSSVLMEVTDLGHPRSPSCHIYKLLLLKLNIGLFGIARDSTKSLVKRDHQRVLDSRYKIIASLLYHIGLGDIGRWILESHS